MPKAKRPAKGKAKAPYPKPKPRMSKVQTAPSAISRSVTTRNPQFLRRDNSVTIRHAEYFEPVGIVNTSFQVDTFAINPGNTSVFPWLATQAFAWERYRFKKLQFRYIPRVGTSNAGTLVLAPDYDADDDAPPNELIACSYADAVSSATWMETTMVCNPEAMLGGLKTKYVRVGALKKNNDIKLYDSLNLFVCRDSANATPGIWGKLWVEYEVEFITPHTIPTPLTSTYAGSNAQGMVLAYPVPAETASITGSIIDKAGPLSITDNGSVTGTGATGWEISGLIPGARYLVQLMARTAGQAPWVYSTAAPVLDRGFSMVDDLIGSRTHTMTHTGAKMLMNDFIVQATEAVGSLRASWTSAASVIDGSQLIISPIVTDTAFQFL